MVSAVRRRLGHRVGADVAAAAGAVLDDHGAQRVLHALGQHARGDVDRAAGRVGHDEADRPRLREDGRGGEGGGGGEAGEEEVSAFHAGILRRPSMRGRTRAPGAGRTAPRRSAFRRTGPATSRLAPVDARRRGSEGSAFSRIFCWPAAHQQRGLFATEHALGDLARLRHDRASAGRTECASVAMMCVRPSPRKRSPQYLARGAERAGQRAGGDLHPAPCRTRFAEHLRSGLPPR